MIRTILFTVLVSTSNLFSQKPNVIIVLADDVGYGDLACHGNPEIKTPNIDALHKKSIKFTNFHVGTTCSPSRAMLMTGKDNNSVGVWHTVNGREILNKDKKIMPQFFKEAGYKTGIFGKWHLGDNYPFRPQDRGFDDVLIHGGGGVGQTPDYWGNDYLQGTYFKNGKQQKFNQYCDDVWFDEAIKFIDSNKDKPFFCFVPTNIAHDPYIVPSEYIDLYSKNLKVVNHSFYGMISKMDSNIGRLMSFTKDNGLDRNTIIIFLSDNGTSGGGQFDKDGFITKGFNAQMRGQKSSVYEGGHRVPFFIYIPFDDFGNKNIDLLASGTDLLPTLLDLCNINATKTKFDGVSLLPILKGNQSLDRTLVVDTQRGEFLNKNQPYAVMTQRWRLVNGKELYDIKSDAEQRHNVASNYADTLKLLNEFFEKWWKRVSVQDADYQRVIIGSNAQKEIILTAHDLHVENSLPAWNQEMVRKEQGSNGFWAIECKKSGWYEFELRRFPKESNYLIPSKYKNVVVELNGKKYFKNLKPNQKKEIFKIRLDKGNYILRTFLFDGMGSSIEAAYVYIRHF
jgi:arylsulfatase A-like enzyme